jgi:hypothetical protein
MVRKTLKKVKSQKKSKSQLRKTRKVKNHKGGGGPFSWLKKGPVRTMTTMTRPRNILPESLSTHPAGQYYLSPSRILASKRRAFIAATRI